MFYTKQKQNTVSYRNYKKFEANLENDSMRFDINNIEFQTSDNILLFVLNEKAPLKQKHLRANNTGFITKDIRKTNKKRL